jgi:hypothetical protein
VVLTDWSLRLKPRDTDIIKKVQRKRERARVRYQDGDREKASGATSV